MEYKKENLLMITNDVKFFLLFIKFIKKSCKYLQ